MHDTPDGPREKTVAELLAEMALLRELSEDIQARLAALTEELHHRAGEADGLAELPRPKG